MKKLRLFQEQNYKLKINTFQINYQENISFYFICFLLFKK